MILGFDIGGTKCAAITARADGENDRIVIGSIFARSENLLREGMESVINKEALLQRAVPAIALPSFTALNTAFCNDAEPELVFAQSLMGLGKKDDILLCISTSGNSKNVVAAALTAKALGIKTIGLTGKTGGKLKEICDICICVPEIETFKV